MLTVPFYRFISTKCNKPIPFYYSNCLEFLITSCFDNENVPNYKDTVQKL